MNLIDQMNVLKGLRDEDLQAEMQMPSGGAPPWLVATEVTRRKDMRQRYEGEMARRKPSTTVVEDLAVLPTPPALNASMGPTPVAPGGIDSAMAPQGFADGGIVHAYAEGGRVSYDDIAARYNEELGGLDRKRDTARALALIAAGGGIAGGKSPNTLRNIGGGLSAFADNYGTGLQTVDSRETELMRGLLDIGQAQRSDELAQLSNDFREREFEYQKTKDAQAAEERANASKDRYSATTIFGVDEQGNEISARTNLTTGEYKPNPRADGTVPTTFIPYSADELAAKRDQAKLNVQKLSYLPADTAGVTDSLRQATTAMDTIKRAYNELDWANTGMIGAVSDALPGGGWAKDSRALIKTLQSGLAASALQAMRDASKTGGALGNVSDKDLELLQTKIVNLDPNQSEGQLKEQLRVIYDELAAALKTRVSTFASTYENVPGAEVGEMPLPPSFDEFMSENVENDPMDSLVDKYRTK
jgi:hypothetical protein